MASYMELKGTTFSSFTIGKRGPTLTQISTTGLTIAALPSATVTPGGPITLTAGANTSALGDGGAINLNGGTGSLTTGSGGKVNINGGAGSGISLTSNGGAVELNGGTGGGAGGDIVLRSGASVTAAGAVRLIANNSSGAGATGGSIIQTAGSGPFGGAITITAGPGSTDDGGSISLTSGTSTSASTGDISISTASTIAGTVGAIFLTGGAASGAGQAGSISIAAGAGTAVGATGGDVTIAAGNTANATNGGNINLQPGTGRRAVNILPAGTAAGQTSELRFRELAANGTNYVGFKGPDGPVTNTIWTLPNADGQSGNVLLTDGSGTLTWGSSSVSRKRVAQWMAVGNSGTISAVDAVALTTTGTLTPINVAQTSILTMSRRVEVLVTVAATTAVAGFRSTLAQYSVGGLVPNTGGFTFRATWSPSTGVATATNVAFCGMANTTAAPTSVQPSTITNMVGMGWDSADTNIQIMHRAAGAVVKIDLGPSFPVPNVDRSVLYDIELFSPPGTVQSVRYTVTNVSTGITTTGTITASLPAALLAPRVWMAAGGTSSVIGLALSQMMIETGYY